MADIVITKTSDACCVAYTIRNFCSLDIELCTVVCSFALPETSKDCNIIVKAQGNTLTYRVSWTIMDESTSACGSVVSNACIKTVAEQVNFLINTFEAKSIEDAYSIDIDGDVPTKAVYPNKLQLSKTASTPITYAATYEFISGDIVASETTS